MALLGFELLFRLLWGSLFVLFFVSRQESSERFLRISFWIALGVAAFGLLFWFYVPADAYPLTRGGLRYGQLAAQISLLAGWGLYVFFVQRSARVPGFLMVVLGPALFLFAQPWAETLNFVAAGLLLGGFFGAQFLGHWFLNVPGLHIRELQRVLNILYLGLTLKTLEFAWTLGSHWGAENSFGFDALGRPLIHDLGNTSTLLLLNPSQTLFALEGKFYFGLGMYGLLLLSMRFLWGILAPIFLAYMTQRSVAIRATQSATGILYAACVMVLAGEATALYLKSALGWMQ